MSAPSFTIKQLRMTFTLSNQAVFGTSNNNVLQISGLRMVARLSASQFPAYPQAELEVYGMLQSDMNALTAIAQYPVEFLPNSVVVEANSGSGWAAVFAGQMMSANPDYDRMPDVPFVIVAQALGFELFNPATPTSYTGSVDVAVVVGAICAKMGCAFENNGVTTTIESPYLAGTLTDQLKTILAHANGDVDSFVLPGPSQEVPALISIVPKGQPRPGPVWTLSPQTGLLGYPKRDARGFLSCRTIFNPAYRFGGLVDVSNVGIPAGVPGQAYLNVPGNWIVYQLNHTLESAKPDGAWFSDLIAYPPGSLQP